MNTLRNTALRAYFTVRNSWPVWYGILNADARRRFASHKPSLTETQQHVLTDLARGGIALTSLDALFPGENMLATLQADMQARHRTAEKLRKKEFLKPFWNERGPIDQSNPFFALALRKEVLNIVNSYDKMWRRLNYLTLAETVPVGDREAVQSQRWHRDPEEKRMIKFFVYLNDIDEDSGPFIYTKGSQYGAPKYGNLFPQQPPLGIYLTDKQIEDAVDPSDVLTCTAKAGTVIFCDTAGLHRGGHAKSKSRFMFTAFYPSSKWTEPMQYQRGPGINKSTLSPEARYALYFD